MDTASLASIDGPYGIDSIGRAQQELRTQVSGQYGGFFEPGGA
jgi:hypothetical protein